MLDSTTLANSAGASEPVDEDMSRIHGTSGHPFLWLRLEEWQTEDTLVQAQVNSFTERSRARRTGTSRSLIRELHAMSQG